MYALFSYNPSTKTSRGWKLAALFLMEEEKIQERTKTRGRRVGRSVKCILSKVS